MPVVDREAVALVATRHDPDGRFLPVLFETATFYPDEVGAMDGEAVWIRARYERPEVWSARLRPAADSVAALHAVLGEEWT